MLMSLVKTRLTLFYESDYGKVLIFFAVYGENHGQKCEAVTLLFIYSKALFE